MLETLVSEMNRQVPRYTSYPTAQEFEPLECSLYEEALTQLSIEKNPISLYVHIPFCQSMCLFCGCSVVLNRREDRQNAYVDALLSEAELVSSFFAVPPVVQQMHFGGGTPTQLSEADLTRLVEGLKGYFHLDGEMAIEIDPRSVEDGTKLRLLRNLGFNRVSLGVQDLSEQVQEAVKRRQSYAQTEQAFELSRALGYSGINIDLIYGLPLQTEESFAKTVEAILKWRPDRIAMYSYARIPWLKPHQKAIREEDLPHVEEKFRIYLMARQAFIDAGYVAIGMDHFALPEDALGMAYQNGRLYRNFQGYAPKAADDLIGLGVTAIGAVGSGYFQNRKELKEYQETVALGKLPVFRGKLLSQDDKERRFIIQSLMCRFELVAQHYAGHFGRNFFESYVEELEALKPLEAKGFMTVDTLGIHATDMGRLFIRNIATVFDVYRKKDGPLKPFSRAI